MTFPAIPPMRYVHEAGLRAARDGNSINKWDNNITGLTTDHVVSTDAAIYYDIPVDCQVMVISLDVGLASVNDEVRAYVAGCAAIAGGGNATQLGHHIHHYTGSKKEGHGEHDHDFNPPLVIRYSDGYRSVSLALAANDTDADVLAAWCGWYEDEGTLS